MKDLNDTENMTDEQRQKHWQAMDDARTLADAEMIKNDDERLKAATAMAGKIAEERQEEARSMATVANTLYDKTNE